MLLRHGLTLVVVMVGFIALSAQPSTAQQPASGVPAGPPVQGPQTQPRAQQPQPPVRQPQRQAQAPGQQVAAPAAQPPVAPRAPFQLTPQEAAQLNAVLQQWELQSDKVNTLDSKFTRDEFDPVFKTNKRSEGYLRFKKPDKGVYKIEGEDGEHWICDGISIYEYNHQQKLVVERRLPKQLQGKAIVDGPLPFIFGAKAAKLKARYFMRLAIPKDAEEQQRRAQAGQIWIEAYPRFQKDAANFSRADLILKQDTMLPLAIRITLPGGKKTTDHIFKDSKVNGFWNNFVNEIKPSVPFGWKMVQAQPEQPQGIPPRAAQRPAGPPAPR